MVTSDHSPALPEMRVGESFFELFGGMTGCQTTLRVLLTEGHEARRLPLPELIALVTGNVVRRFRLPPTKGRIAVGTDADLALVDLSAEDVLRPEDLLYRHRQSAFVGRRLKGRVVQTLLRGQAVVREGRVVARAAGRLVRPVSAVLEDRVGASASRDGGGKDAPAAAA
jgi:allantoinase